MVAGFAEDVPAFLLTFFDGDSEPDDFSTGLTDYVNECEHGLSVGEEVVHDQDFFACFQVRLRYEDIVHPLVSE